MAYLETASYVDSVAYAAVAQWAATHAYSVGNIVRQLTAPTAGNERCYVCIAAGTSGSTEPTWAASNVNRGNIVTDGSTVKWIECTGLPVLNGDSVNVNKWRASAGSLNPGWIITNTAATHYFICTTAGSGGTTTEPSWNTTAGGTTTDGNGSAVWTCLGPISSFTAMWAAPHGRLLRICDGNIGYWLLNAGMTLFVGDDHAESNSAGTNYAPGYTCSIVCVDHTTAVPPSSANLKTTASITSTAGSQTFISATSCYVYGIQYTIGANLVINVASGGARSRFEKCLFAVGSGFTGMFIFGDGANTPVELKDCSFSIANWPSGNCGFRFSGTVRVENGVFTATVGTGSGSPLLCGTTGSAPVLEGCDFSGVPNTQYLLGSIGGTPAQCSWLIKDSVIPAGMGIYGGVTHLPTQDNQFIDLNRVDSGVAYYRNERYNIVGQLTTSSSIVRSSGASDGSTPVSHQVITNSSTDNIRRVFNALPLATWNSVTGTNRNVTLYGIINDSRVPNNDELWFDAEYLGSATSPKGSYVRGGKSNILAAGSALTADSTSAWDSAATARANTTAYVIGNAIKTASNAGRVFFCTIAGTSAGSEPGGYATAVDGGSVTDGGATFRAGCRFSQTLTLSSPQPQQAGYLYAYPKVGRASTTYYIDPKIYLS
jgi:hypothetical protein